MTWVCEDAEETLGKHTLMLWAAHINDDFVKMLFEIIEQVSDDVNDPYHYPTIRVLV